MIVGFLDLLGFSQLLEISTEIALDNANSFSREIERRIMDRRSTEEYIEKYPDGRNFAENSIGTSFDHLISFSDSLILGSKNIELFVRQLCNFVSSLYIISAEPFREPFEDVFNVYSKVISSYENGMPRYHKAFPILFRGGLSVGGDCFFFEQPYIKNGVFCNDGYNVFGKTYLNAVKLEKSGKGPRLFCDRSVVDNIQNKRIIREIDKKNGIFEIAWTIEGCETLSCCSEAWNNVMEAVDSKLLPPAINFVKFYNSNQKYEMILPHYSELLKLVCRGIVKYAEDECNEGGKALEKINFLLGEAGLSKYILSDLLDGFIE